MYQTQNMVLLMEFVALRSSHILNKAEQLLQQTFNKTKLQLASSFKLYRILLYRELYNNHAIEFVCMKYMKRLSNSHCVEANLYRRT